MNVQTILTRTVFRTIKAMLTSRYNFKMIIPGCCKSSARPTSRYILFGGEDILFDASLVIYINSTNIPPIMIINRINKNQNLLSL